MKILIDESLPRKLKVEFAGHDAVTVPEMGWAGKKNGELLRLMVGQFDAFVTIDANLQYQQNLTDNQIAVIVLAASSNRLDALKPLMPRVLDGLTGIQAGQVVVIRDADER